MHSKEARLEDFEEAVQKAIKEYNRYRSPEATASLIKVGKNDVIIDFEGPFCASCGTYDFLEDFIYELQRIIDVDMKIDSFESVGPEKIRVRYIVLAIGK